MDVHDQTTEKKEGEAGLPVMAKYRVWPILSPKSNIKLDKTDKATF